MKYFQANTIFFFLTEFIQKQKSQVRALNQLNAYYNTYALSPWQSAAAVHYKRNLILSRWASDRQYGIQHVLIIFHKTLVALRTHKRFNLSDLWTLKGYGVLSVNIWVPENIQRWGKKKKKNC